MALTACYRGPNVALKSHFREALLRVTLERRFREALKRVTLERHFEEKRWRGPLDCLWHPRDRPWLGARSNEVNVKESPWIRARHNLPSPPAILQQLAFSSSRTSHAPWSMPSRLRWWALVPAPYGKKSGSNHRPNRVEHYRNYDRKSDCGTCHV